MGGNENESESENKDKKMIGLLSHCAALSFANVFFPVLSSFTLSSVMRISPIISCDITSHRNLSYPILPYAVLCFPILINPFLRSLYFLFPLSSFLLFILSILFATFCILILIMHLLHSDPSLGEFILTADKMKLPDICKTIYSVNGECENFN